MQRMPYTFIGYYFAPIINQQALLISTELVWQHVTFQILIVDQVLLVRCRIEYNHSTIDVEGTLLWTSLPLFDSVARKGFENLVQNNHIIHEILHPLAYLTRSRNKFQEELIFRESINLILSLCLAHRCWLYLQKCYSWEDQENWECDDKDQVFR